MGRVKDLYIELARDMDQDDLQAGGVQMAFDTFMNKIKSRVSFCCRAPLNVKDIRHVTCSECGKVWKINWMNQDIFKK